MKCVNCMGPEEYINGLCFQCYLKTVPPGKVVEYNPKKFDLNKQLTILKVCSKCNREISQHEPAWMLVGGGYCCEDCRNPGVTEIVKPPFPGTSDPVSHPSHYTQGGIETIDFIRAKLTKDEFVGYCMGNVLKYTTRYKHKNGVEDLKKAQTYLTWAIERMEQND